MSKDIERERKEDIDKDNVFSSFAISFFSGHKTSSKSFSPHQIKMRCLKINCDPMLLLLCSEKIRFWVKDVVVCLAERILGHKEGLIL